MDLAGRVIVVTGASSGIGAAVGRACATQGASVVLAARRTDRIDALAAEIEDAGGQALAVTADVAVEEQAAALIAAAIERFGRIDVLVNNAGVMLLGPIAEAPTDEWRRMVDVNVMGVLYCTHAALPPMLEQGSGHIVNVSSIAGRMTSPGIGVYALTKHGIGAFTEVLRQETTGKGIRVTLVEPGSVATELRSHNRPPVLERLNARWTYEPLEAERIADGVVYALAQPDGVVVNELMIRPAGQAF